MANGRGSAEPLARPSTNGHPRLSTLSALNGISDATRDETAGRLPSHLGGKTVQYLAEHPGSSGREVKRGMEIRDDSQAWTLLKRLERDGLAQQQPNGSSSVWTLTGRGQHVLRSLPEGLYASGLWTGSGSAPARAVAKQDRTGVVPGRRSAATRPQRVGGVR